MFQVIKLTFLKFAVEEHGTFVKVYDGEDSSAPLLDKFTGSRLPNEIVYNTTYLFVSYESHTSWTNDEFNIKYTGVEPGKLSS